MRKGFSHGVVPPREDNRWTVTLSEEQELPDDSRQEPLLCVKGFSSHMPGLPTQKVGLEEEI